MYCSPSCNVACLLRFVVHGRGHRSGVIIRNRVICVLHLLKEIKGKREIPGKNTQTAWVLVGRAQCRKAGGRWSLFTYDRVAWVRRGSRVARLSHAGENRKHLLEFLSPCLSALPRKPQIISMVRNRKGKGDRGPGSPVLERNSSSKAPIFPLR